MVDIEIIKNEETGEVSICADFSNKRYEDAMRKIAFGFLMVLAAVLVILAGRVGIDKNEIVECDSWSAQAAQYSNFYLTQWQKDQCDAHGITINAPVK